MNENMILIITIQKGSKNLINDSSDLKINLLLSFHRPF